MERDSFEDLVLRSSSALNKFAVRRADAQDTADIVAETYAVAWAKCESIPTDAALIWLYTVELNVIRNYYRSKTRQASLVDRLLRGDRSEETSSSELPVEEMARVRSSLARLRESDQEVLRLVEWEELDSASAAAVLGCSQQALRVRLHRARRRLADQLAVVDRAVGQNQAAGTDARTHHVG